MEERRKHPRIEAAVIIDITFSGEEMVCFAADISLGGVRVMNPPGDLTAGDTIGLAVHPREEDEEPIRLDGRVVWVSNAEAGPSCGVEFVEPDDDLTEQLQALIDSYALE